jgi:predicted Zn-dependent protease
MKNFRIYTIILTLSVFVAATLFPQPASPITIKEEEDLSRQIMRVIFKYYERIDDPVVEEYINNLGDRLVTYLPEKIFDYDFYVVKADEFNAFAIPGGKIFINSGLLNVMEDEEELAGILSHEIAHVYCRHISQRIERSKKISYATLAGIAAGVLVGATTGSGELASAMTKGSAAAGQSAELAYTRENEIQADQIGLDYLYKAGYGAEGLLAILKKMRSKQWFGSDMIPTYLMTHPAIDDRIAYIDTWVATHPKKSPKTSATRNANFERVQTLVLTRYGDEKTVLANLEAAVRAQPQDVQANYRYGLILARVGQREKAIKHIKIALEKRAFDIPILTDLGRIYYLDGQYQKATSILQNVNKMRPDDPESILYLGRIQMEMGQFEAASDYFHLLVKKHPNYNEGIYLLGQSLGKEGKLADAHYYLGVYYLRERDLKSARVHFRKALPNTQDTERKEKIEKILAKLDKALSKNKK